MGIVMKTQEDPDFGDRPVVCLLSYSEGSIERAKKST